MTGTASVEIVNGFIEEVEGYLPAMRDSIRALERNAKDKPQVEEMHRLAHIIKGAASMVDLNDLGSAAGVLEDVLDDVMNDTEVISKDLLGAMHKAIDGIAEYCRIFPSGESEAGAMIADSLSLLKTIRSRSVQVLPPSLDFPEEVELEEHSFLTDETTPDDVATGNGMDGTNTLPLVEEELSLDPELIQSFREEAAEHLADIGNGLRMLESRIESRVSMSENDREAVRKLRRSVHTLKGAAGVVGISDVADWGHDFEDFLDWLYEEAEEIGPDMITAMLDASDILDRLVGTSGADVDAEIKAVKRQFVVSMGIDKDHDQIPLHIPDAGLEKVEETPEGESEVEKELKSEVPSPAYSVPVTTLRVELKRIDRLVGQMGEMATGFSSFDQIMTSLQNSVEELNLTAKRLKNIAGNLETGYELATIPHIGGSGGISDAAGGDLANTAIEDFDPLELDRYSELNIIIRSLNEVAEDLSAIQDQTESLYMDFDGSLHRQRIVFNALQNTVTRVRMSPLSGLANRLSRTVRETARQVGKKAKLVIEGGQVEMDKQVWEKLADPLMHLLRNSVEHGIESVERRRALGKFPVGIILLQASRKGNQVTISLSDDGAGLDFQAIESKLAAKMSREKIKRMTRQELSETIFQPGFSTKTEVTQISGRGMGLDVVKTAIQELNGSIEASSGKAGGLTFTIRLPVRIALFQALLVRLCDRNFAFHLNEIERVAHLNPDEIEENSVRIGADKLPLIDAGQILGLRNNMHPSEEALGKAILLIVENEGKSGAIKIDGLLDRQDMVFKDLGSHLRKVQFISGVTITGDGKLVPILNPYELLEAETDMVEARPFAKVSATKTALDILIADDSVSVRRVLSTFIKEQGWNPITAKDGVDALEMVRETVPDLILLDIEMPKMNGFEVMQVLRAQPVLKNIPVVMLTSRSARKYQDRAESLGARGYVTKPYREEELISLITSLTSGYVESGQA